MTTPATTATSYPMRRHDGDHHAALAALLDPNTRARLAALGGRDGWAGATCLEVGAGGGTIALALAEAVGGSGRVVATDLRIDQIPDHPRLVKVRHDVRGCEPLPLGPYQLIHARWVLEWLPEREDILDRLVGQLAPGGAILVEALAPPRRLDNLVIDAPTDEAAALHRKYQRTLGQLFDASGMDAQWAPRVHAGLRARGLVDVDTQIHGRYWTGGDTGCRMVAAILQQMRPRLLEAGLTGDELDAELALLDDPRLVLHGHVTYATSATARIRPTPYAKRHRLAMQTQPEGS